MTRAPRRDKALLAAALALALLALLIPLSQCVWGVRLMGKGFAQDGAFAVSSLSQFRSELASGSVLPRWSYGGNFGLGSPVFFFYPPAAYYVATAVSSVLPGLADETVLGVAEGLFAAFSIALCARWVSRRNGWAVGLLAGAMYGIMPYIAFINPQLRLAYAEMAAAPLWPLSFLLIDKYADTLVALILSLAAAIAAFGLVHAPSFVIAAGLLPFYAILSASSLSEAGRRMMACLAGVLLGCLVISFYLLPALALQRYIPVAMLDIGTRSALLTPSSLSGLTGKAQNFALILPAAGLLAAFRPGAWREADSRPLYATLGLALILMTALATPIWVYVTPLHKVQFPWRLLAPASLLGAAAIARVTPELSTRYRGGIIVLAAALAVAQILGAYTFRDPDHDAASRSAAAESWWNSQPAEYTPLPAATMRWLDLRRRGGSYAAEVRLHEAACLRNALGFPQQGWLLFNLQACAGHTVLPVFNFPGWRAEADGQPTRVSVNPSDGLVQVSLRAEQRLLRLSRVRLREETLGGWLSAGGVGIWIVTAAAFTFRRRSYQLRRSAG